MDDAVIGTRIEPWGVWRVDPGFIYVLEDRERYKIGRTHQPAQRFKSGRTWLPEMKVVGCKPFWSVRTIERHMQAGFAIGWVAGEWFQFRDPTIRDLLVDGFTAFSDTNRDRNSVDFIYWMNSDGMGEFVSEQSRQRLSLPRFLRRTSTNK